MRIARATSAGKFNDRNSATTEPRVYVGEITGNLGLYFGEAPDVAPGLFRVTATPAEMADLLNQMCAESAKVGHDLRSALLLALGGV